MRRRSEENEWKGVGREGEWQGANKKVWRTKVSGCGKGTGKVIQSGRVAVEFFLLLAQAR